MGGPALPAAASPVAGEPVGLGAGPRRLRLAASHLLRDGVDGRHRVVGVDDGPDRLGLGRGCDGAGLQEMLFRRMLAPGGNRAASDRTPQWPQYLNATGPGFAAAFDSAGTPPSLGGVPVRIRRPLAAGPSM